MTEAYILSGYIYIVLYLSLMQHVISLSEQLAVVDVCIVVLKTKGICFKNPFIDDFFTLFLLILILLLVSIRKYRKHEYFLHSMTL